MSGNNTLWQKFSNTSEPISLSFDLRNIRMISENVLEPDVGKAYLKKQIRPLKCAKLLYLFVNH